MPRRLFELIGKRTVSFETRIKGGVLILLVLSAMVTSLRQVAGSFRLSAEPALGLSRHEKRLEPLRQLLPPRGIVGYVTDATPPAEAERRYHMTRYVLAPLIVVRDASRPLVVGDFTDAAAANRNVAPALLRHNLGQGLVLFARDK